MRPFDKCLYNKIIFYICLFLLIAFNLSFTWPMENFRITSTFGESRGDHFHSGVDLISGSTKIYPAEEGELVFFWDNALFPTENYPGGGNYKILRHKSGYYSVYMHLNDNPSVKNIYLKNDSVGEMGATGHSSGKHLHLSIFHSDTGKFVNPVSVFPKVADNIEPVIEEAYVRIENKYFRIGNNDSIRLTKHYPLLINIWDLMHKGDRLGVYKLLITLNGEKIVNNNYSDILMKDNALRVSGKAFDELFDEKGYYKADKIKYVDGVNDLSVTASDYSGNESTKKLTFTVKLDMQQ
ncbi:MAG: M23 family metallopeptidase [Spirochaetota bacterium]